MTKLNIKIMNGKILSFFLMMLMALSASAQITVNGLVLFGEADAPVPIPGYPIAIIYSNGDQVETIETFTWDDGTYELTLPLSVGDVVSAEIMDLCTGEVIAIELPDADGAYVANFHICTDIVPPPPPTGCEAYFTHEQTSVDPYEISFFDLSYTATPIESWEWDFGDGTTSNEDNPVHEYAGLGEYEVSLTITADTCSSTISSIVIVSDELGCGCPEYYDPVCVLTDAGNVLTFDNPCFAECEGYGPDTWVPCDIESGCYASFYMNINDDPNNLTVEFVDQSVSNQGDIVSWEWSFGDGETSTTPHPSHTYAEAGIYEVVLTISTEDGCSSSTVLHICIGEEGNGCNCDDVYDPVCASLPGGIIITFPNACEAECAGFGPDSWVECEEECPCFDIFAPVCVMTAAGDTLTFFNACFAECEGYGEDSFVDCNEAGPCECTFEYDPVCVTLPDGSIVEFPNACFAECEGFGEDTFVDCDDNPDPCVCPDIFAPVCVVTADGDTLSFSNSCFAECEGYSADQFFDCNIDFPCGCPFLFDPVCVLTDEGEQLFFINACLAECEGYGEDSYVDCENDFPDDCYADFYIDYEVNDQNPLTVQFHDLSQAVEGEIIGWLWDFGDGNTSEEQNPTHTFPEDGIYEVTLTIATSEDCSATTVIHICVGDGGPFEGPDCQAFFFFAQSGDNPHTFQFTDLSFGGVTSWTWDFGDGFSSDEQHPSHTYAADGVYPVTLTIASDECESTMTMIVATNEDIWYNGECTALFVPLVTNDTSEIFFLNLSSPDAIEFSWDFGDGTTSDEPVPMHQYETGGTYTITLTITTIDGCVNSFSVNLDLDDNEFTGSPAYLIVSGTEETTATVGVKAFPNPVLDQLHLAVDSGISGDYQLDLYSVAGQRHLSQRGQIIAGNQLLEVNLQNLPAGIYLVKIQVGDQLQQLKVVKQ